MANCSRQRATSRLVAVQVAWTSADVHGMKIPRHLLIRAIFFGTLPALLLGTAAMANAQLANSPLSPHPSSTTKHVVPASGHVCSSAANGTASDQTSHANDEADQADDQTDQKGSTSGDQCPSAELDPIRKTSGADMPTAAPTDREADCKKAAGRTHGEGGGGLANGGQGDVSGDRKTTGLDHAIQVVLGNCLKNPQAHGLPNALRRLTTNRDRHEAHEAEKDERKTASNSDAEHERHSDHEEGHGD